MGNGRGRRALRRPCPGQPHGRAAPLRWGARGRSALRVETASQRAERQLTAGLSGLERLQQIAQLTLLAAILAMTAAMTGLLWQHRTVVAGLKVHGLRTRLLWMSLLIEAVVLLAIGTVTGGAFALLGQVLGTRGVQVVTDFPVAHEVQFGTIAAAVGLVAGASLLVVLVPGYLVARVRPRWNA